MKRQSDKPVTLEEVLSRFADVSVWVMVGVGALLLLLWIGSHWWVSGVPFTAPVR